MATPEVVTLEDALSEAVDVITCAEDVFAALEGSTYGVHEGTCDMLSRFLHEAAARAREPLEGTE